MKDRLNEKIDLINKKLEEYIPLRENPQRNIYSAMRYSLLAGGKRLRPILLLESCRLCGGREEDAMPLACAVEMIHTYSLIHDDLPAMDNDDFRRGKPTNHKVYGEAMAILAGDALLNLAFETALKAKTDNYERLLSALKIMFDCSGTGGMIGGQVVDLENESKKIGLTDLKYTHLLKTGALIDGACVGGAVFAGANKEELDAIKNYSSNMGIAFQIQDDILDVTADQDVLGKPVGSDEKNHKNTYVTLCGLETAKAYTAEYTEKAIASLEVFGKEADFLRELTKSLLNRAF